MTWLSKHLGVRLDSHTLGNVLKNVSPALAITPAGVLGTAGLAAAGEALRGKTGFGDLAKSALSNAAIGAGGAAAAQHAGLGSGAHLGFGLGGGEAAAPVERASEYGASPDVIGLTPPTPGPSIGGVGVPAPHAADLGKYNWLAGGGQGVNPAGEARSSPSWLGRAGSALRSVGDFTEKNPTAVGMGLQGLGHVADVQSNSRMRDLQADELAYDLEARKKRDDALQAFLSQYGGMGHVAPNPYSR